jgi:phospholipid transport system substrate-binding protein
MKKLILLWATVLMMVASFAVRAEILPPDELIRSTVSEVLEVINHNKDTRDQRKLLEFVDAKVLPHFDFERMTKLAVGPAWRRTATPEQKKALVSEFRTLLVRTYSNALTQYKNISVEIKPLEGRPSADEVTVKTVVKRPSGPPILVNYYMEKTDTGWKAVDVSVEGVLLVATRRNEFIDKINQVGIDGLIQTLAQMNQSLEKSSVSKVEIK